MEEENTVNENEVVAVDYTEILEQMYGEMQTQTEELAELRASYDAGYDALMELSGSVLCLLVITVLTFCWSCMRQWRKNVLKLGE